MLWKKSGYPGIRYKSHYSEQYNAFDPKNTKKDLYGRPAKQYASFKKFHKTKKNMQMHRKALKKQNKVLFKLAKKTSSQRELKNIKSINKESNDYSRSDSNSVSSN